MHMCDADLCVAAGLQTFSAGRKRTEFQCRWKRALPTNHFQSENAGAKKCAFLNVCTASNAIRDSQKGKMYVSRTITVT